MTDDNLLDLLAVRFAGHTSDDLGWRELIRVRDAVDSLLNAEISRRQLDLPAPRRTPAPGESAARPDEETAR